MRIEPTVADLGGVRALGPKCLHFHAVFRNSWPNNRLAITLGNPGAATDLSQRSK